MGSCPRCTTFGSAVQETLNEIKIEKGHGNRFGVEYIIHVSYSLFSGDLLGLQTSVQK